NGKPRSWDLVRAHDSVAILLYHKAKDSLVFVRQFRPAVYMNKILSNHQEINENIFDSYPTSFAFTLEMCAGILDKNKSPKEIAKEEIYEECGFDVPLEKIEKIVKCAGSVGISGTEQTMFYAEVNDEMRTGNGCGNEHEGEMIEVVYYPVSECRKMIFDETVVKSTGLMFAILWFLADRYKKA
uniref:Uridine diphosphate glucose pyrophosphatase NUDT14 n=1 Tax=Romanomermis culicivorax TaxID=13658 RepID=A0A915KV25_ROMCU